ncbi:XRE family transcriptional regulator [Brevibacterium linens ATCC 9172]|nr:XRE family transcriptional regulator [Brevibacterium linens ATCC 9172]
MSRASAMIRRARVDAGLTQSVLAERSGVAQSVISSYEKGRREPSASALDVLLTAAGFRLVVEPEPESLHKVRTHSAELIAKLAELGGHNISVFGSVARGDDRPDSDVDLLIDIDDSVGLFKLMKMRSVAERILGREVDLIPRNGLKASVSETALLDEVPL